MAGQWKVLLENVVDNCSCNNKLVILSPFCHFRICSNVNFLKTYQQVVALFNKYTPGSQNQRLGMNYWLQVQQHLSEYWFVIQKT